MRLMPKSAVTKANADAKRKEIDEGLKLAKRVDGLRKTVASEEQSLEKFRASTVANIKAEITPLEEKRDSLKKEVEELQRTRAELLLPLDEAWEEVELKQKEIEKKEHDVVGS